MASEENTKRVLLISNSTLYGSGYLDHAESEIRDFQNSAWFGLPLIQGVIVLCDRVWRLVAL